MDGGETLEAIFLGRDSVVLDVEFYYCVYVVHIVYSMILPMVLCGYCIYGVVFILHMQCWI